MIKTTVKVRSAIVDALDALINDESKREELLKALSYHEKESDWNCCGWDRDFDATSIEASKTDDGIIIKIAGPLSHDYIDNDSDPEDYGIEVTRDVDYDDDDDKELFDDEYKGDDNDDDVEYDDGSWRRRDCFDSDDDESVARELDTFAGGVIYSLGKAAGLDLNLYDLTKLIFDEDTYYDEDEDLKFVDNAGSYDKDHFFAHVSSYGTIAFEIKIK